MTDLRITWHQYRYFPYERELAIREAQVVLGLAELAEHPDGLLVPPGTSIDAVKRLTYFASLRNGKDLLNTTQRELENSTNRQATRYSVHGLHEYKGKFNPQIAKAIMNIFGVGCGSRVLDPFCGSGTTLVEATQMGATAIGTDLNPFAVFLANAKQLALNSSAKSLQAELGLLKRKLAKTSGKDYVPLDDSDRVKYLKNWFEPKQLNAIENLRSIIENSCGELAPIFLTICSDQLREYSLQDPKDLRIRRRKSPLPTIPFEDAFIEKAEGVLQRIESAQRVLGDKLGSAEAILCDNTAITTKTFGCKFDCAITSPPYAMALPYIDTQRLSLVWLGLADPALILPLESSLIGSREIRSASKQLFASALDQNPQELPSIQLELCQKLASSLAPDDGFRRQAVPLLLYRYFASMRKSFIGVKKAMIRGAPFALVVGHNHTTIGGTRFDINTPVHLADLATHVGWTLEEMVPLQTYRRFGYHAANAVEAETLIILRNA
jgi:hypothetical protein